MNAVVTFKALLLTHLEPKLFKCWCNDLVTSLLWIHSYKLYCHFRQIEMNMLQKREYSFQNAFNDLISHIQLTSKAWSYCMIISNKCIFSFTLCKSSINQTYRTFQFLGIKNHFISKKFNFDWLSHQKLYIQVQVAEM